jgi:two-component system, cell cycle sensor histidine kinase and response regulator CckA
MKTPIQRFDPPTKTILLLGVFLAAIFSALYLMNTSFLELFNYRVMDAVLANSSPKPISGDVVVVDIDEKSLASYGQWPWPRYRLANLLKHIKLLGARSIGLNMILAEPDRTSLGALQDSILSEFGYQVNISDLPNDLLDNDATLADVLSQGPFVLGFEFLFQESVNVASSCQLHPLNVVWVQKQAAASHSDPFFQAKSVVCNLEKFSTSVSLSGFLNGTPDADGMLRRIPLVIMYRNQFYPNLALATLLQAAENRQIQFFSEANGQSYFFLGNKAIPVDQRGNILIHFPPKEKNVPRMSAEDVLNGRLPKDFLKDKIVFIGISASGLDHIYQTPVNPIYSQVEIHAQSADAILTGNFIRRNLSVLYYEAAIAVLLASLYGLCLARFGLVANAAIGCIGVLGVWQGAIFVFQSRGILVSPLLPAGTLLLTFIVLTIYKYWKSQRGARKSIENALILLKASENKLNSIINTIPDIVFRLDPAGRITFISPAISKYARQPEELMGTPMLDLVEPDDRDIAKYRINERRTGKRATSNIELRLLFYHQGMNNDDSTHYFSVSAEGIYAKEKPDQSSFLGTQGIARDITARKQLENQLEQSQKMEAVGNLAAGVAHDLNNILSGLVSYPELMLLEIPPDSPMRKNLEKIQQSGQKAAAIVQDMLTLARRGMTDKGVVNLNTIISEYLASAEFSKIQANHPRVRLETDLFRDLLNIRGSSIHLSKLLMNLINNAAEAMPAGGRITLHTRNRYLDTARNAYEVIPEGEYVRLSVADEGVGIAPNDFKKIFEPFYTKKSVGQSGTGLGMTVIWNTVKDHAGYIDLQSREGEGTRFDIYLPATREASTAKERRVVLQDYVGTERILVVDDVPDQRDIAVKMLGKLGYAVTAVPSGEAAVAYMQSHTTDLLVLDMVMVPGIDGLETYRRIISQHPGQKAIITSGFSESERVRALQELGAGAYIRKPYTLERIGLAVRRELDRK